MQHQKLPFKDTKIFSPFFLDYISEKDSLKQFYGRFPTISAFQDQIKEKEKNFPATSRQILKEVLTAQYVSLTITEKVSRNIEALGDKKTFTVTTGHQLNIFTGPLYFIYKIVSVVNACKALSDAYPDYHFVPVYWMASEDHDFEEISYFKFNGTKYTWKTDQKGGVGRFDPRSLKEIIKELPGDVSIFEKAYGRHEKLSDAVRYYVNQLFGEQGLVVIDADNTRLKSLFKVVIKDDLFNHSAKQAVETTNAALSKAGYSTQVFARDINFFYLDNQVRERFELIGDRFTVLDSEVSFSNEEIERLVESEPEKFSPNVILRPLYQEMILPNLAYFGGPAEVIYWLQLKGVFEHYKVTFPILMPRNFALVMDGPVARKFEKTGLSLIDLFEEKNYLFNDWVLKNTHHNLTLTKELNTVKALFTDIKLRAIEIDKTLDQLVAAEGQKAQNSFEKIERKLLRAEKRLHTDKLRQIGEVKEALFPAGGLQERSDNFLNFYQSDPDFINKLLLSFDPFDFQFNVLSYPYNS